MSDNESTVRNVPSRDATPRTPAPYARPGSSSVSPRPGAPPPAFVFEDDDAGDLESSSVRRRIGWPVLAVIAGIVVILIIVSVTATRPHTTPLKFTTASVVQDNLAVTVAATGPITSGVYNLSFFTNGRVIAVDTQVGQQVKAGQTLAQVDPTPLQDALTSAQNALSSAEIGLGSAYTNLANAQDSQGYSDAVALDQYNAVVTPQAGKPAPTPQQIQQAQDQLNQAYQGAKNQVSSAYDQVLQSQAQVQSAKTQAQIAQDDLANATIVAPVSGQVTAVNGAVGEASGSGAFIQLVNLSQFQIAALVNEADIGSIQVGQPVTFTVQAFPQDTFYGTIASISPLGQVSSNVVSYPVTVTIDPKSAVQARLFPQMTATLSITTQQALAAILVPNTALTYARQAVTNGRLAVQATRTALAAAQQDIVNATTGPVKSGTASYVLELQKGKLVAMPVVTGITDGTDTVVLMGLNVGDTIVTGDNQSAATTSAASPASSGRGSGRGGAGGGLGGLP